MKKQDDYVRTALRAPRDLHARLHEAAEASGRSFNAEIIARLEASFSTDWDDDKVDRLMKGITTTLSSEMAERFKRLEEEIRKNPIDLSKLPIGPAPKFSNSENE